MPQDRVLAASHRFLALFSEFGLASNLDENAVDLVALLPAVAAACEAVRAAPHVPMQTGHAASGALAARDSAGRNRVADYTDRLSRQGSSSGAAAVVLASLDSLRAHDSGTVKLFRNAWLYCGMLGLQAKAPAWLKPWPGAQKCLDAMGRLAASTPVLMYGTGAAKDSEAEQRVLLELQPHLEAAGARGEHAALAQQLQALLGEPIRLPARNASTPFLLAVATLEMARAQIGPLHSPPAAGPSPIIHAMAYAAGAGANTTDSAVYIVLIRASFDALTQRLTSSACKDAQPFQHLERLADMLIQSVCWSPALQEANKRKAAISASDMLQKLLHHAPALHYSRACIESWLAHGRRNDSEQHTAAAQLSSWLTSAASRAPTHMEHLLGSLAGTAAMDDTNETGSTAFRPVPLFNAIHKGRQQSQLEQASPSPILANHDKSMSLGRVDALQSVLPDVQQQLLDALEDLHRGQQQAAAVQQQRCCDAAAAAVMALQAGHDAAALLRALAALPAQRFASATVDSAAFAWHWLSAESSAARDTLIEHMQSAWQAIVQQRKGLFSGSWLPPVVPLSSGDLRSWDVHAQDATLVDQLRAHHAWIMYLLEMWEASRHAAMTADASPLLPAVHGILRSSLTDTAAVCTHPLARLPLFRLLTLALRFCKHVVRHPVAAPDAASADHLLQQALQAALHSFVQRSRVMLPPRRSPLALVNALESFLDALGVLKV